MGCMNGRCSDDNSEDRLPYNGQLLPNQQRPISINSEYSVRNLPPSPSVTTSRSLEDASGPAAYQQGFVGGKFEHSAGGTASRELDQHHLITSTQEAESRNGIHRGLNGLTLNGPQAPVTVNDVKTARGKEIFSNLRKSYDWRNQFDHPSQEFLSLMDRLYMECQLHLTALSSRGSLEHKREADMIVQEMITVRNHWGADLLPNSICNAFVRERIPMTLGTDARQFRIDCAQFFEPVPFYGTQQAGNPGELMKLFRFSVYDLIRNEVVLRYYLERSNVTQLYHVLCFTCESYRGQVHPYGSEQPSYWDIRHKMMEDVCSRLLSALSPSAHPPPQPHVATIYPPSQGKGGVVIQVPTRAS